MSWWSSGSSHWCGYGDSKGWRDIGETGGTFREYENVGWIERWNGEFLFWKLCIVCSILTLMNDVLFFLIVWSNNWSHDSSSYTSCSRIQSEVSIWYLREVISCLSSRSRWTFFSFVLFPDLLFILSFITVFCSQISSRENQGSFRLQSSSNLTSLRRFRRGLG